MLYRVPFYRQEAMKRYPGSVQSTVDRVQMLERRIREVAEVSKKYEVNPPP